MNISEWLAEVDKNKDVLRQFISQFHPGMDTYSPPTAHITAPNAEVACQVVRSQIKRNTISNPLEDFDEAIKNKDWRKINYLLNSAWVGVPETTSCWSYTGFTEAVALMEDTPCEEVKCEACNGEGKYSREGSDNMDVYEVTCDLCNGTGRVIEPL